LEDPAVIRAHQPGDEFNRLHRLVLSNLAVGAALAWALAIYAGLNAPWVGNIVFLIDPTSSRVMSTGAYLFTYPSILLVALGLVYFGRELIYRLRASRSPAVGFALAGAALFTIFILAVERASAALRLGWL
jgi:hypothetical protein